MPERRMLASPERYGIRPGDPSTTEDEAKVDGPPPEGAQRIDVSCVCREDLP